MLGSNTIEPIGLAEGYPHHAFIILLYSSAGF
jgi:hypothetical protein